MADEIKPNAFSEEVKTSWVNEAEGMVQTEVMLVAIEDVITYSWEKDKGTELLVRPPHDKLYWTYLTAMIDFANGEYNKYQNTMQLFNAYFSEYMRWFAERYRPADGEDVQGWPGYYISPYGIAVKHGFVGTEEDWLASLKGDPGAAGEPGKDFRILGRYDTLQMLVAAVPDPEPGDTYDVGTEYPYNAYMWDGVNLTWVNKGPLRGPQGEAGYTPVKGVDYFDGKDGTNGKDGYTPVKGVDYFDGKDGQKGSDGYSPTVDVSKVGKTTTIYITDVNGTEQATVKDGEDGANGKDGNPGVYIGSGDMPDGYFVQIDPNGKPLTFDDFKGEKGEPGIAGEPGKDGETPHIGANGNWYVGAVDTGVKAQGEDGKPGADGYTPIKGVDYFDGKDGQPGKDGADGQPGADGKDGDDYVLTDADKTEIAGMAAELVDVPEGGDYIPVPATASVGQTIKVSAVDDSGKPTAWEAVDFPTDEHINGLINTALGVVENGSY